MNDGTERNDSPSASDGTAVELASLSELLDHFLKTTEGQDQVAIADLLNPLSGRSYGPLLMFPAIIAISPIGMIPGMSVITGTLIVLIASQMLFLSKRPWIPSRLAQFEFSRSTLKSGIERTRPWVDRLERWIYRRFDWLTHPVMVYPIAILSILLAVLFYPLALVPFGVLAPGVAILLLALGLTTHDGLLVLSGFLLTAFAIGLIWWVWPF